MKKVSLLIAMIAFAVSFSFQSCKKANEETTTERNSLIQEGAGGRQMDPTRVLASLANQYGELFNFNSIEGPYNPSNTTSIRIYVVPASNVFDYFYLTIVLDGTANILGIYVTDLSYAFPSDIVNGNNDHDYNYYFYNIWDAEINDRFFYGTVNIGKNSQIVSTLSVNGIDTPVNPANYHFFYNLSVGVNNLENVNMLNNTQISAMRMALQMAATFYLNFYQ